MFETFINDYKYGSRSDRVLMLSHPLHYLGSKLMDLLFFRPQAAETTSYPKTLNRPVTVPQPRPQASVGSYAYKPFYPSSGSLRI